MAQELLNPKTGKALTLRTFGGVELDIDAVTGGVWMDGGEMDTLTEWFHDGDDFSTFAAPFAGVLAHDTASGACPRCCTPTLREYPLPRVDGTHVTLDICGNCKGFWVDGPELAPVRETMMMNKKAQFQARIMIASKRSLLMQIVYPGFLKNIVDKMGSK